ncbi:MAG: hypothetical protein EA375_06285 [Acholeplasmataceae bacterium]|nr:MAG: hypothetical protein EA375_06285 [Acholeplasmataceae bacterium]
MDTKNKTADLNPCQKLGDDGVTPDVVRPKISDAAGLVKDMSSRTMPYEKTHVRFLAWVLHVMTIDLPLLIV